MGNNKVGNKKFRESIHTIFIPMLVSILYPVLCLTSFIGHYSNSLFFGSIIFGIFCFIIIGFILIKRCKTRNDNYFIIPFSFLSGFIFNILLIILLIHGKYLFLRLLIVSSIFLSVIFIPVLLVLFGKCIINKLGSSSYDKITKG
jgi:hypothetical protein